MSKELVFHVAPDGSDLWSGKLPAPAADRSDGPFATVARARDAVRALNTKKPLKTPVRVLLRGGLHFLPETLVFTPADSGTATCPITYAAYPGEAPVLSGGRKIGGWKPGTVNGKSCWQTTLPEVAAGKWYFTQLFVNGTRRLRPRLPREGHYRFTGLPEGHRGFWYQAGSANFFPGELRADWYNREDIEITALQHWFESHLRIKSIDDASHTVVFQAPAVCDLADEAGHLARYSVVNVFEALENPGEWYLDRATGTLTYLPLAGETPANLVA